MPIFQFEDNKYQVDQSLRSGKKFYPEVSIYYKPPGAGKFDLYETDDSFTNLIKILSKADQIVEWSILWRINENDIQAGVYYFVARRPGMGDQITSMTFDLQKIQNGAQSNFIRSR